jgi:cytochrome c553
VRLGKTGRTLLLAGLAVIVAGLLLALAFIRSGLFHVGATSPHSKLTYWITHETMIHSVRRHARSIQAPGAFTRDQVERGFCAYETHCVACHGWAGVAREPWAGGMEPSPPYLLDVSQQFRSRELFWIARNGIKMTGMPAWSETMDNRRIWELVAFLEIMPKADPGTYTRWRSEQRCRAAKPGPLPIPAPPSTRRP